MVFLEQCSVSIEEMPKFPGGFVNVTNAGKLQCIGFKSLGESIGPRYVVQAGGVINTYGQGEEAFPGNFAGVKQSGGLYIP